MLGIVIEGSLYSGYKTYKVFVYQSQTCCCFSKLRLAMRANESGFPLSVDIGDPVTSATTGSSDVDDMSSDEASF